MSVDLETLADGLESSSSEDLPRSSNNGAIVVFPSWFSQHRESITFFGFSIAFLLVLFFVALGLVLSTHPSPPLPPPSWNFFRLPETVKPMTYVLNMTVDLDRLILKGRETIRVLVKTNTTFVVIHSAVNVRVTQAFLTAVPVLTPRPGAGKSFERAFLEGEDNHNKRLEVGEVFLAQRILYNAEQEHFLLQWRELEGFAGKEVLLGLEFETDLLATTMRGAYVSTYFQNNEKNMLVSTQFEPTDARAAFPCFDEPQLKAAFLLTVRHKRSLCLSNMPVVSEVPRPHGFKEVTFQLTPPMSTYLLAFVVADFPHVVRSEPGKIPVKVYARSDVVTQGQYAADITFRLVEAFGGMYAASYALPKLDLVAVPDFAAGAMENWGLMTFREVTLLYDPASSSTWSKQVVAKVVAHEIAHQWFGDLVTMQWWNEVWLNEGFAEFVEYLGVEMVEPSWQVWDHFLADDLSRALELDALPSAPPLVMHEDAVETDDQIDSRFSGISYSKGASLLRMLRQYIDSVVPDSFLSGTRAYIKAHRFGNANSAQFFGALAAASGADVASLMSSWTFLPGYPEVEPQRVDGKVVFRQRRFFLEESLSSTEDRVLPSSRVQRHIREQNINNDDTSKIRASNYIYQIPLSYRVGFSSFSVVLNNVLSPKMQVWEPDQLVVANLNRTGYFRVWYGPDLSLHLADLLSSAPLQTSADLFGLLDDYWQFSFLRPINISTLFNISLTTGRLSSSSSVLVAKCVTLLREAGRLVSPTTGAQANPANRLIRSIIQFWEPHQANTHDSKLLRFALAKLGPVVDATQTIVLLKEVFGQIVSGITVGNDPDLIEASYFGAVIDSDSSSRARALDWLLKRYRFATQASASDRLSALMAYASCPDSSAVTRLLQLSLDANVVRKQDQINLFFYASLEHPTLVWEFIQSQWGRLSSVHSQKEMESVVLFSTRFIRTTEERTAVRLFLSARGMNSVTVNKVVDQSIRASKWIQLFGVEALNAFATLN